MKVGSLILVVAMACMPLASSATTWGEDRIKDPIDGRVCKVQSPMSSGSYIFHWPEKYDQVFWPLTDRHGIWSCAGSGFVTLIGDVELDEDEKARIAEYLRGTAALKPTPEPVDLLDRLQSIYALRTLDPDVESRILRAMAYQYEGVGSLENAAALRTKAATLMETRLGDANLKPDLRLQYLFVTANYARERGDTATSDAKLDALASLLADALGDDALKGYAEYLRDLIEPARKILPGGHLAPVESSPDAAG